MGASHGFSPRPVEPLDWRTTPSPRCDGYAFNEPASGGHTSDIMDLALRIGGIGVNELIARVEVEDFDTWLQVHRSNAEHRSKYGMTDGPIYRDIDDPSAVLVHTHVEELDRALQWFGSEAFKQANAKSTAVGREFYIAQTFKPGASS